MLQSEKVIVCVTHQIIRVWMAAGRLRNSRRKPWWSCRTMCRNPTQMTSTGSSVWAISTNFESYKLSKLKESWICFGRLTRILTRLPALRLMNSSITEELFFTGLIGSVSIDSIIPYILKMETAEYNSQDSDPTGWRPVTPAARTNKFRTGEFPSPSPRLFANNAWYKSWPPLKQSGGIQNDLECFFLLGWNTVVLWVVNSHWTEKKKKKPSSAAATLLDSFNDFVTLWNG